MRGICDRCQQPLIEVARDGEWLNVRSHVYFRTCRRSASLIHVRAKLANCSVACGDAEV